MSAISAALTRWLNISRSSAFWRGTTPTRNRYPRVSRFSPPKGVVERTHNPRVWLRNASPNRTRRFLWAPQNFWGNIPNAGWRKSPKKNSPVNATNPPYWRRDKGHTRPQTPWKMTQTNIKIKIKPTCVLSEWSWSRYELVQGHAGRSQSQEVDLVDRSRRQRRPRKVPRR